MQLSVAAAPGVYMLCTETWGFWLGGAPAAGTASLASNAPLDAATGLPGRLHGRRLVVVSLVCVTTSAKIRLS